jgi:alkanesulfonate monooxygenase SsuD/methylene tetrahydromethanopterin reductase-like flavin-dependent oxidoreductase (luciferase family)
LVTKVIDFMADAGFWLVGTPDDCIAGLKRLEERSGGYGGFLVQTIDWAPRRPNAGLFERRQTLLAGRTRAIDRARQDCAARKT